MRVLVLTPSSYPEPGGLQRYTYNLAISLARQGHQVTLFTLADSSHFESPSRNLTYVSAGDWGSITGTGLSRKIWQKLALVRQLDTLMHSFRPDIMICTWWDPLGYLASLLGRFHHVPYICVGHGQEIIQLSANALGRRVKQHSRFIAFNNASRIVAVSRFTRDRIVETGIDQSKIQVIPNGLLPEYIDDAQGYSPTASRDLLRLRGRVILQVGRLVPRKGHDLVLSALRTVQQALSEEVNYVIVGSGPSMDDLRSKARAYGVEAQTIFAGFVPDDRLHLYYSAADVVVMPSFNPEHLGDVEGFGIVYLEAYAHGKPVIGAACGGAPDAIVDGETGLLIPPGDATALANGLIEILKEPEQSHGMGRYGRELLYKRWNWDLLANQFLLQTTD